MRRRFFLSLLLVLTSLAFADDQRDSPSRRPGIEAGTLIGTPSILNFSLAYWGGASLPIVTRFSGMYLGRARGLQIDLGWVLEADRHFRHFVGLGASTSYLELETDILVPARDVSFTGAGPFYEVTWEDWSIGGGAFVGRTKGGGMLPFLEQSGADTTTVQFQLQFGYKTFWDF